MTILITRGSAMLAGASPFKTLALLLAVIAATCVGAQTGHATTFSRTFVSNAGVSGNTAEGCSAASPCDTFAHALSMTSAGGEINCLNAGEFGTVTINQAVTINCGASSNGGITAIGITGITIETTGAVILIGLDINGMSAGGGNGVLILSNGSVNIRNCKIHGFQQTVADDGAGIRFATGVSGGNLVVDNVLIAQDSYGIQQYADGAVSNMTVRNSNINNNGRDGITVTQSGSAHAGATIEQTTLAFNSVVGLVVFGGVAVIGGSTIVNNVQGVTTIDGGSVYSFKNNQIGGNSTDGTPLTAYPGGPLN